MYDWGNLQTGAYDGTNIHPTPRPDDYRPNPGMSDDEAAMRRASNNEANEITRTQDFYRSENQAERERLNREYEGYVRQLRATQAREFAGRSTGLITSGGYLGTTQSHEGDLSSLRRDQEAEIQALYGKKDAAVAAARKAYLEKDFALAKEKAALAKELEGTIIEAKDKSATRQLAALTAKQNYSDKLTDNARQAVTTYLNQFGAVDVEKLSPQAQLQLKAQVETAGYSWDAFRQQTKTLAQTRMQNTQDQNEFRNMIASANLSISKTMLELAKNRDTRAGQLTETEAVRLGLPRQLVGKTQDELVAELQNELPPAWFVRQQQGPNAIMSVDPIKYKKQWDAFRQETLKPVTTGFSLGSLNISVPPVTTPAPSGGGESDTVYAS